MAGCGLASGGVAICVWSPGGVASCAGFFGSVKGFVGSSGGVASCFDPPEEGFCVISCGAVVSYGGVVT